MNNLPEFYLGDAEDLNKTSEFHDRIVEFIEKNLEGKINETTLCLLISTDGTVMTADLPPSAYKQSIQKSLKFYIENENYEMCTKIKNIINKL
jgi:hypothetical protein